MASFGFVDIILFLGVSQGLFLSISLRLIHNRNVSANRILSLLLLIVSLMLFCRITAFRISEDWIWRFGILIDTTIFLFGPLLYLYVKRLVYRSTPPFKLNWVHYIPALLHLCYYFWTLSIPLSDFNNRYFSGGLNIMFFVVEASGLLSLIFYWIRTFLLIRNYSKEEKKVLSYRQNVFQFLKFFLFTLLIFVLLWSVSFIGANFLGTTFIYLNYVTMWISIPIFIYIVGYFSLRQPEIFRIPVPAKEKSEKQRLKPDEIQKLQKRLHYFISEEKTFVQPDITLKSLAEKMNTSRNNLSWLLNQTYQVSFYDYINRFRIEEFLLKINNGEHLNHTLLALAMDVGFNSKSTFNKAFKNEMGLTPSDYIKKHNVA
ncbi:AraC family transcriptional regulator [Flagellimonas sp. HMM57]|uniref:helix-turn-helix domain-containing protein n=1 Tax=unclassified Flagellimonas TaxID=2644544 RepID=UPI0013D600C8|nr:MULTISPECIES: AraC family transcriptional regulator [unclassified Flagellimonas]UII75652.1 AraC family transcriptional regulator [Flagellimonas sp. HMM57]